MRDWAQFKKLLSISIGTIGGSVRDVGGLNGLTLVGGDLVNDILAVDLGDGVAVLHLHGDGLHLGVVNTVLGGDLTAGVLHGGLH